MKKYYLISYGINGGGLQAARWTIVSELTPLEFILNQNTDEYKHYYLVFAMEITEKEYNDVMSNGCLYSPK